MTGPAPSDPPIRGHWGSKAGLALLRGLARLPLPVLRALGGVLGTMAWWLARPRRHVTLVNLRMCFPAMPEAQRRRIGHEHFRWFMRSILERFIVWECPPERLRALVRLENEDILQAHLHRPLIILVPHFVGLDACGMRLAFIMPWVTVYQRQKNPVLERAIRDRRTRQFGTPIGRDDVRAMLRALRRNEVVWYAFDQNYRRKHRVFAPFFGVPAATNTATSRLAQTTGAAVVPFYTRRLPGTCRYVQRIDPALEDFPGDDAEADAARLNALIEGWVREAPEQYLWTHRRFRTRPRGEPKFY